jgi:hypothetical protein
MGSGMSRMHMAAAAAAVLTLAIGPTGRVRAEQQPPPIHGVTGTVATEESTKDTTAAGRGIFSRIAGLFGRRSSATADAAAEEAFTALKAGMRVVVSHAAADDKPAAEIEAVIMDVNRNELTVSIRLEDGARESLRLSDGSSRVGDRGTVVIFTKDNAGERVPHYFKRIG